MEPDVSTSVLARTNLTPSFRRRNATGSGTIKSLYFVGLNEILVSARYGPRIRENWTAQKHRGSRDKKVRRMLKLQKEI